MMQTVVAVLAFGAIAALGLWWGVRRDHDRRASPGGEDDGDPGFTPPYGDTSGSGMFSSSWDNGDCDSGDSGAGDSGGGDCGGDGGGGD
jgi:hypothetical protein